jgi:hypothetical protein
MIQQDASPFTPASLPDEHYLSYLWRWANLSGSRSLLKGLTAFIGNNTYYVSRALTPQFLASVLNQMPEHFDSSAFMFESTQERYFKSLKVDHAASAYLKPIGKSVGADFANKHLRWCVACAKEDDKAYGIAYWRNSHQDPRLVRCNRHGLPLLKTCHLCKQKKGILADFGRPPTSATCQYCNRQLDNRRVTALTPFQLWLEQLHHLANHKVQFDRTALINRIQAIVEIDNASIKKGPRGHWDLPQKNFIKAFNSTRACNHFSFGEVPYASISSYVQLRLRYVLDQDIQHSSVVYALLGWAFLPENERNARFGVFAGGKAIPEAA